MRRPGLNKIDKGLTRKKWEEGREERTCLSGKKR
jgi:hypothetical protein